MKMASFLTALSLTAGPAFASTSASYPQKLAELRQVIRVDFGHDLSEFQKAEGVEKLYALYSDVNARPSFGETGLIQRVIIQSWSRSIPATDPLLSARTALRDGAIFFPIQSETARVVFARLALERDVLRRMAVVTADIQARLPKVTFERTGDISWKTTASNQSYLAALEAFQSALASHGTAAFRPYSEVTFEDRMESFASTGFDTYQLSYNDPTHRGLRIQVARLFGMEESLMFSPEVANGLVRLLSLGFDDYSHSSFNGVGSNPVEYLKLSIGSLNSYLTPENTSFLKSKGVTGFRTIENPEHASELFTDGVLKVGVTEESIRQVVDLLFGN